jgi:hypothetical protein
MSQSPIVACFSHLQTKLSVSLDAECIEAAIEELNPLIILESIGYSKASLRLDLIPTDIYALQMVEGSKYLTTQENCTFVSDLVV